GISAVIIGILLITLTQDSFDLIESAFEVVSAFATVGSSIGGSPNLNVFGKIVIMMYMFMGRVGFLTIFIALLSKNNVKKQVIRFPEGKIIIG
ncbi:MAG: potassium transporter TrkG, partial [Paraclostridium sp.]